MTPTKESEVEGKNVGGFDSEQDQNKNERDDEERAALETANKRHLSNKSRVINEGGVRNENKIKFDVAYKNGPSPPSTDIHPSLFSASPLYILDVIGKPDNYSNVNERKKATRQHTCS